MIRLRINCNIPKETITKMASKVNEPSDIEAKDDKELTFGDHKESTVIVKD